MKNSTSRRLSTFPGPPYFLSGLAPQQEKNVLAAAQQRRIPARQVIFRTGEPATRLFMLKKGCVRYYRVTKNGEEVPLCWLAPGDIFGIGTLLPASAQYIATAEAVDDCVVLVWSRNKTRSLALTNPILVQNALHIVLYYLAAYSDRLVAQSTSTADERLAFALLQLGRSIGVVHDNGVELPVPNEELAGFANISSFTTSRILRRWEREGIVRKYRGGVVINSPERLLPG